MKEMSVRVCVCEFFFDNNRIGSFPQTLNFAPGPQLHLESAEAHCMGTFLQPPRDFQTAFFLIFLLSDAFCFVCFLFCFLRDALFWLFLF